MYVKLISQIKLQVRPFENFEISGLERIMFHKPIHVFDL